MGKRRVLLPPYLENFYTDGVTNLWVDLVNAIDAVFQTEVDDPTDFLRRLRYLYLVSQGTETKISSNQLLDFGDFDTPDKEFLIKAVNTLGQVFPNPELLSREDYLRVYRNLGMYWYDKGRKTFIDFIGFLLNCFLDIVNLWSGINKYITLTSSEITATARVLVGDATLAMDVAVTTWATGSNQFLWNQSTGGGTEYGRELYITGTGHVVAKWWNGSGYQTHDFGAPVWGTSGTRVAIKVEWIDTNTNGVGEIRLYHATPVQDFAPVYTRDATYYHSAPLNAVDSVTASYRLKALGSYWSATLYSGVDSVATSGTSGDVLQLSPAHPELNRGTAVHLLPKNLLTDALDLTTGSWVASDVTVTPGAALDLNGDSFGIQLTDSSTTAIGTIRQGVTVPNNGDAYCASLFVKKTTGGTAPSLVLRVTLSGGYPVDRLVHFNSDTGTVLGGSVSWCSVVNYSSSLWLLVVRLTNNNTGNTNIEYVIAPTAAAYNSTSDIYAATGSAYVCWPTVSSIPVALTPFTDYWIASNDSSGVQLASSALSAETGIQVSLQSVLETGSRLVTSKQVTRMFARFFPTEAQATSDKLVDSQANLWTMPASNYVYHSSQEYEKLPEGDPLIGTPIWQGGNWFPTTHVRVTFDGTKFSNVSDSDIVAFFYSFAPYNLVLESIVNEERHGVGADLYEPSEIVGFWMYEDNIEYTDYLNDLPIFGLGTETDVLAGVSHGYLRTTHPSFGTDKDNLDISGPDTGYLL